MTVPSTSSYGPGVGSHRRRTRSEAAVGTPPATARSGSTPKRRHPYPGLCIT